MEHINFEFNFEIIQMEFYHKFKKTPKTGLCLIEQEDTRRLKQSMKTGGDKKLREYAREKKQLT